MSDVRTTASTGGNQAPGVSAGALLVAAREASGLSIDAVAQQLKLAPRQVRALEQGNFGDLPGRTFVRGFVRSYARLLRLDPESVLRALPVGTATPALEAPTLQPTAQTMGELPTTETTKASWTRWAIPLSLAAVVAAAAAYEWMRPAGQGRPPVAKEAASATDAPATPAVPEKRETPLPNPLAGTASVAAPTSAEPAQGAAAISTKPAQGAAPSSVVPAETKGTAKAP